MQNEPQATPPVPPQQPVAAAPQPVVTPADVYQSRYVAAVPPQATPIAQPQEAPQPMQSPESPAPVSDQIEWRASEYVDREKSRMWFFGLAGVTLVLLGIAIFLMKDITFAVLVVVMSIAVFMIARRPAREMQYRLSRDGLSVNDKFFHLHDFRAFGVVPEGAIYSVSLIPNKRFAPSVNVYFPQEYGEAIVDLLGSVMPMEDVQPDFIDRLTNKLHF